MPDVVDLSTQDAQALLDKDKQDRVEACTAAVKEALEKNNCNLLSKVSIVGNQIIPEVIILAADPTVKN